MATTFGPGDNDFTYTGMPNQRSSFDMASGMTTDPVTGKQLNYRQYRWDWNSRLYDRWMSLNKERDIQSDLTNLPGDKEVHDGKQFRDDWFAIFPSRRRFGWLYPNQIEPNVGL